MPRFMSLEDYEHHHTQTATSRENAPSVSECLSGRVQHLQATPQGVFYQNLRPEGIEETTLLETAFHQTLKADRHEHYTSAVHSTWIESAPSIDHTRHIEQTDTTEYETLIERLQVQQAHHQIYATHWRASHRTFQLKAPTSLKECITETAELTTHTHTALLQHQFLHTTSYRHCFEQAYFKGPLRIQSAQSTQLTGNIHFGGPTPEMKKTLLPRSLS